MFTPARRNERCQPGARLGQKQKTTTNLIINYRLSEAVAHRRHGFTGKKKKDEFDFSQFVRSVENTARCFGVAMLRIRRGK